MPEFSCSKRIIIISLAMGALIFVVTAALIGALFGSYKQKQKDDNVAVDKLVDTCSLKGFMQPSDKCSTVQITTTPDEDFSLPTEAQTAKDGHLLGVAPVHYNWTMNFTSAETYMGKVSIMVKTFADSKRILLHANTGAFDIYYDAISVWSCTSSAEIICVDKITVLQKEQAILLDLNRPLKSKGIYIVTFNKFNGSAFNGDRGSAGLRLSASNSPVWAVTTIFQMRLARTVFPCFDHPSLKSTFSVCIEHPSNTLAYSNTAVKDIQPVEGRILECYRRTPRIPTYVATVSLLGNFSTVSDNSTSPRIELFFPSTEDNNTYAWEINMTRNTLEVFENYFGLQYNLSKLGFINVNPSPFWGIENFGLVTLESGFTRFSEGDRGKSIIIHEIIHQWLGDVATTSYWDEICLQEGLTAYLEMFISEKLKTTNNFSLNRQIRQLVGEYLAKDHTIPTIQSFNVTQDIADVCFGKPVIFMHTVAYGYGNDLWVEFLKKLVEKFGYANANFNDWVNLVNEISGSDEPGQILTSLFKGTGYPIIFASVQSATEVKLEQKKFFNEPPTMNKTKPFVPNSPIPLPIRILTKDQSTPIVLMNSVNQSVIVSNVAADDWILVDPDSATFSRKVYTVSNYLAILDCFFLDKRNSCRLELDHIQDTFVDFCFALLEDQLPWGPDAQNMDVENWEAVLEALRNLTSRSSGKKQLNLNRVCECCFRTKEELIEEKYAYWHPNACRSIWNDKCRNLNLMKVIERDYLIPDRQK